MAKKPEILHEPRTVYYGTAHWNTLEQLRKKALEVMMALEQMVGIQSYVHGSIARGDTSKTSDIDIVILDLVPSYKIEIAVGQGVRRELIQATPSSVIKGYIHLDERTVISFPVCKMMTREREFYKWGGLLSIDQLRVGERILGVDKRLLLIEPTQYGHIESGVIGYEHNVVKRLGVSMDIARERIRVLMRRDMIGRTGVYLSRVLSDEESFEGVTELLKGRDPAIRRTIAKRNSKR